ncbi:MAG: flagellar basal body-associated FliL family protein [Treponema sp.]|nr:flagellar basal body-associated FliL family protein [Treponema sp.]MCL2251680.1 flagellar basal body-associated FliL family protein [Treponema sp.]
MSDEANFDDIEGGDAPDAGGGSRKKSGGLGNILPNILKFVAIGLGALVFIVTVCVITYNIMNKGGKSTTVISDPNSPYVGTRPLYNYYDNIGSITVETRDFPVKSTVTVDMILCYDLGDQAAAQELSSRRFDLRDFVRAYFRQKTVAELGPEREEELKRHIREELNTRFLDTARVRNILFNKLDVTSVF